MSDTFLIQMGNRICNRRKEKGLTQEQVAEAMKLSTQSLSCIENGKKAIRPENLFNLCNVLNISPDFILSGRKSEYDVSSITQKLINLTDSEYRMVGELIDYFIAHHK